MRNLHSRVISPPLMLVMLSALIQGCGEREAPPPAPPAVVVAPVISRDVLESERYVAQTVVNKEVNLVARVKGFLDKRPFEEGAFVQKGRILYVIEKDQYKAQLTAAEADLQRAQAKLKDAQIEYQRNKKLYDKKAVSERDFDTASMHQSTAEAQVKSAQAKLSEAKLNLSYTDIKAPFDGKMGVTNYFEGNLVQPSSGTLATIVQLSPIKVEFNVSESALMKSLQKGMLKEDKRPQDLIVKLILPDGKTYDDVGKIVFIDNKVNSMTGTIKIRAVFDNKDFILLPGLYVQAVVERDEKRTALLIPASAVQEDQAGHSVMVVDGKNVVSVRRVQIGAYHGANVIVKDGLKKGELVITEGLQKVRRGLTVKPVIDEAHTKAADEGKS